MASRWSFALTGLVAWSALLSCRASPLNPLLPSSSPDVLVRFARDSMSGSSTTADYAYRQWATVPDYNSYADILLADGDATSTTANDARLVWVTREVVSEELEAQGGGFAEWMSSFGQPLAHGEYVDNGLERRDTISVLQKHEHSALLRVPSSALATLDSHLGRFTRAYLLPVSPPPLSVSASSDNFTFPKPRLDPFVSSLTQSKHWDTTSLTQTALTLTGEDQSSLPADQRWTTRHSATSGCQRAGRWLLSQAREALRGVRGARCELEEYLEGHFAPNVVCVIERRRGSSKGAGSTHHDYIEDEAVLLSAHYDSRGSFGDPAAPGGDDDGSGSTMLLAIARVLGDALRGTNDRRSREIQLVWFSGEEEGLVGSSHYAQALSTSRDQQQQSSPVTSTRPRHPIFNPPRSSFLRLAVQTDMIGYHVPGEPLQISFPDRLATDSATKYMISVAQLYSPELTPGYTPACCSDHQSFWEVGYPATQVFERNGPIADPKYHNSGDIIKRQGYDFEQIRAVGRVVVAGAAGLIWE